jgi:hypothetical protein
MKLEELKNDAKRLTEGVICVLDTCDNGLKTNSLFESYGEICTECPAGFYPDSIDESIDLINKVRRQHGNTELE